MFLCLLSVDWPLASTFYLWTRITARTETITTYQYRIDREQGFSSVEQSTES